MPPHRLSRNILIAVWSTLTLGISVGIVRPFGIASGAAAGWFLIASLALIALYATAMRVELRLTERS